MSYSGPERRGQTRDRRLSRIGHRAMVLPELKDGWLCFENEHGEKRRLMPVPKNWDQMTRDELLKLCSEAKRVVRCGLR